MEVHIYVSSSDGVPIQRDQETQRTGSSANCALLMLPSRTDSTQALVALMDMRLPTPCPPPVQPVLIRKHWVPCVSSFFCSRSAYLFRWRSSDIRRKGIWSIESLVESFDWIVGWLIGWIIDWIICGIIDWVICWMIDWWIFAHWLVAATQHPWLLGINGKKPAGRTKTLQKTHLVVR